jgi:hypothetical protein
MQKFKNILRIWLPAAVILTGICGLVYMAEQQSLRQGANDPQIQLAEDAAAALSDGKSTITAVVPASIVDVGRSLAPFIMAFDPSEAVSASSGLLHGQNPVLPAGVLDYVKKNGEDRITWQPEPGVRIAAVVERVESTGGFVLAGRSLREVEKRENQTVQITAVFWLVTLAASLLVAAVAESLLSSHIN